jgi:hypothetical protein
MMVWVIIAFVGVGGGVALRVGLRGRRIDDHPVCRKCGFDLTGTPESSWRCSECGTNLRGPGAVRIGHRRRRAGRVVSGVLLVLAAITGGTLDVAERTQSFSWIEYAPVKWLLYEGQNGGGSARTDALKELLDRAKHIELNSVQISATVSVALTMQGDASKPWDPAWGDIIESERGNKRVNDEQWKLYAHQALRDAFALRLRPAVRLGDPLPAWIDAKAGRTATNSMLRRAIDFGHLRFADFPGEVDTDLSTMSSGAAEFADGIAFGSVLNSNRFPKQLSPGDHPVHIRLAVKVGEPNGPNSIGALVSESIDLAGNAKILPATQPTVKAVSNPQMAEAIRKCLSAELQAQLGPNSSRESMIWLDPAPAAVSFNVFVVFRGKEYQLGSFSGPAGAGRHGWGMMSQDVPFALLFASSQPASTTQPAAPPLLSVIFRSDPAPAIDSTDVTDYWDGTIELKDVPVQR